MRRREQTDRMREQPPGRLFPAGLFLAFWLLAAASALAQGKFDVTLERNPISLGEITTLNMTVENGSLQSDLNPPQVPGLQWGGTSQQTQMFFDGSQMTRKTIVSVEVRPTREGNFTIPAIQAMVDGRKLVSKPLTLKVIKGNLPATPGKPERAFVRLSAPTNTIYVGQGHPGGHQLLLRGGQWSAAAGVEQRCLYHRRDA